MICLEIEEKRTFCRMDIAKGCDLLKTDVILYISISLNVVFIILSVRVFYYGRKMWAEIVEHDEKIDCLLQD